MEAKLLKRISSFSVQVLFEKALYKTEKKIIQVKFALIYSNLHFNFSKLKNGLNLVQEISLKRIFSESCATEVSDLTHHVDRQFPGRCLVQ